jgi:LPS sulfotransferase NodH
MFDNAQFHNEPLKILYILVSTPRCGSTALCAEIYRQSGLVVHEYLQPSEYLPALASRMGAIESAALRPGSTQVICLSKYLDELIRRRAVNGVLGVCCHASHLVYLNALVKRAKHINPSLQVQQDYLSRRNKFKQATSYAIASQTRSWSQTLPSETPPLSRLMRLSLAIRAAGLYQRLQKQDRLVKNSYKHGEFTRLLTYEVHVEDNLAEIAKEITSGFMPESEESICPAPVSLHRQWTDLNVKIVALLKQYRLLLTVLYRLRKVVVVIRRMVHSWFPSSQGQSTRLNKGNYLLDTEG